MSDDPVGSVPAADLPDALEEIDTIIERLGPAPALFLDYDGTLTPIVDDPAAATLSTATRRHIDAIAGVVPTSVVSGRGLADVQRLVGLTSVAYAGSHGLEIVTPQGTTFVPPDAERIRVQLTVIAAALLDQTSALDGVVVEAKPFSLSIHTRAAPSDSERTEALRLANACAAENPGLAVRPGRKETIELVPDLDWDKGRAVGWLLDNLHTCSSALHIGDDVTDEHAFRWLVDNGGFGVVVGDDAPSTFAEYRLDGPPQVAQFLRALDSRFAGEKADRAFALDRWQ